MNEQIHWYPGHINKSIREIKVLSKNIDCFFLILDARAPRASFLNSFQEIIGNKNYIVLLNKADLVEKNQLKRWVNHYKKDNKYVFSITSQNRNLMRIEVLKILKSIKFKSMLPKFMILGIPNVGKSTFLNNISNKKKAEVQDKAGVTRKLSWYQFDKYWISDTPGILEPKFELEEEKIILASIGSFRYDILPMDMVAIELLKILEKKSSEVKKYFNFTDLEEDVKEKIKNSKVTEFDYYKKIVLDFQKEKFGKIILDDF